jgi:hypothetical protein
MFAMVSRPTLAVAVIFLQGLAVHGGAVQHTTTFGTYSSVEACHVGRAVIYQRIIAGKIAERDGDSTALICVAPDNY